MLHDFNLTYYSSIILGSFSTLLFPKLCWHIGLTPIDMCVPAHAIPTFVTEALHLVAYVRLFINDYESEVMAYTALACS